MVHRLLEDWHTPDAIGFSPAEIQLKTDLEEVVRSGLVNFASVLCGCSEASTRPSGDIAAQTGLIGFGIGFRSAKIQALIDR